MILRRIYPLKDAAHNSTAKSSIGQASKSTSGSAKSNSNAPQVAENLLHQKICPNLPKTRVYSVIWIITSWKI